MIRDHDHSPDVDSRCDACYAAGRRTEEPDQEYLGRDGEAYLNLADELDPLCGEVPYVESEWDADFIARARRYAERNHLPFPPTDGIDLAIERTRSLLSR